MYQQYINGKLVDGLGKQMDVFNPATYEIIGTVGTANAEQAQQALDAAAKAFKTWSKTSLDERIGWMNKLREVCLAERETLAELVSAESGRTYAQACGDVDWFLTSLKYYGDEARRVYGTTFPNAAAVPGKAYHITERRPIGVVVGYIAWNYPLGNASLKICPSMASGCTCIIKPSSQTPLATLYIGKLCEKIGLPAGVVNIISGPSDEVGRTLNESPIPKMITLIGSSETGLRIMREGSASVKKYSFELGGNAPVVVMDDVNVQDVAANIVAKKVGFAGQTCVNYNRIYVHEKIYAELCQAVADELDKVKLGKGHDEGYVMGPLIDKNARDRVLSLVDDAVKSGAKLVKGGEIPEEFAAGAYMTPTLLVDVTDDMRVSKEEIFGPVIPMQSFSDFDEALEKANNTIYGLSAYYFGHDARQISKAFEAFEAGEVFVNGCGGTEQTPHSGTKQSGVGADKSAWSLEEYYDFHHLGLIP